MAIARAKCKVAAVDRAGRYQWLLIPKGRTVIKHMHACRLIDGRAQGTSMNNGSYMQNLSPRHVLSAERHQRLGVQSGWYSTKVSGTFVSGPHPTEAACRSRIDEINPPPAKKKRA